jgi:hypothetical protein
LFSLKFPKQNKNKTLRLRLDKKKKERNVNGLWTKKKKSQWLLALTA